jgi:signal transduction histidine kinase
MLAGVTGRSTGESSSNPGGFDLSSGPRLELDQLLLQLVERAQDVLTAQNRLRGLYAANNAIIGDLDLPVVLRRIVEAACELVSAKYGALGVLSSAGGLEEFIHVGIDDPLAEKIGHLPSGKGLLGALIDDPRAVRLRRISDDARSVGFPEHHPPMSSFLGVPIRVRDAVFGNLYLSEAASGEFTEDDEQLVTALAATAGVVIENARLFAQAQRRQDWLQASMMITRQLLAADGVEPLNLIAEQARQIADADIVSVVLPTPDRRHLMVEVAAGERADELVGHSLPVQRTMTGEAFTSGRAVLVEDASVTEEYDVHLAEVMAVGPVMAIPLVGTHEVRGSLLVGRRMGAHLFESAEVDMAVNFANQAAVALELADARADQQRMVLLEDRDRIARDLHDHVIQRLFATGLTVQGLAGSFRGQPNADRLEQVVTDLDETIRQVRSSIFELRGALGPQMSTARTALLDVVGELNPVLGFSPRLRFAGPIDALVPEPVVPDLIAVVREALTNVAKHARASFVDLMLTASADTLVLEIADDGVGIPESGRRSGLQNMARRAERHGGSFDFGANSAAPEGERRGTRLTWMIPLS